MFRASGFRNLLRSEFLGAVRGLDDGKLARPIMTGESR